MDTYIKVRVSCLTSSSKIVSICKLDADMKYFHPLVIVVIICIITTSEGRGCPSYCTADVKGCKDRGGQILGLCLNGLACCDVTIKRTGTCGAVKTGLMTATFVSPNYPKNQNGQLLCTFGFVFMENSMAAKIEFIEVDGRGFAGHGGKCDSDKIYFKGFKSWTPPAFCGNLTGYTTFIERTHGGVRMNKLDIVAVMSSLKYKFKIRISQILAHRIQSQVSGKLPSPISSDRNLKPLAGNASDFKWRWGQPKVDENHLEYAKGQVSGSSTKGHGILIHLMIPFATMTTLMRYVCI